MDGIRTTYGFHDPERDDLGPFVWTKQRFGLGRSGTGRYAVLLLCYNGDEGVLRLQSGAAVLDSARLLRGWRPYCFDLTNLSGDELHFELDRVMAVPTDPRELGVALRDARFMDDAELARELRHRIDNERLNRQEWLSGVSAVESYPVALRINLETRCTIKPPCVYCEWDWAKRREKECALRFTRNTLRELGAFCSDAVEMVDCSVGEPLLNPDAGWVLAHAAAHFQHFEMTSNGQSLDAGARRMLLGRDLWLFVSVDSATAEGYGRFRNAGFDRVVRNVRALCREKAATQNLPRVFLTFIMMRANVEELPAFLALARDLGVDGVKLRSLYCDAELSRRRVRRGGFEFSYDAETLTTEEIHQHAALARRQARQCGITLLVEQDFAGAQRHASAPLCSEPWRSIYVLNRGIIPCCFSRTPMAEWSEQGERPLAEFLRSVFTGPAYRQLRASLKARTLPEACLRCSSCPIVRNHFREQGRNRS